jgi:hypothetical protein
LDDAARLGYPGIIEALKRAGAECGTSQQYSDVCKQAME